jgi:PST family polysaccharide transporter
MGGQAVVTRAASLVGFVVVARFLDPHDYGLAALAAVFSTLIMSLAAAGYAEALVQRKRLEPTDLDTVFWVGFATSLGLMVVLGSCAWPLAAAFDEPRLQPVLQVLLCPLPLVSLRSVNHAVLQRELRFREIGAVSVQSSLLAVGVAIGMAVAGLGVWALVAQTVVAQVCTALGMAWRGRYLPGRRLSRGSFRATFPFSRNYLGVALLTLVNQRVDDFLVGSTLGLAVLGVYTVAYRILLVLTDVLTATVGGVAFPLFARLQAEPERLRESVRSALRACVTVVMPVFVLCSVAAPQLVHLVFGSHWAASAPVMEILCLVGPVEALLQVAIAALLAVGEARSVFRITLLNAIVQVIAFAIAVSFGIRWVAASYVLRAYLLSPLTLYALARTTGIAVGEQLRTLAPAFAAGAVMFVIMLIMRTQLEDVVGDAALLVALVAAGAAAYLAVLGLAAPDDVRQGRRLAVVLARRAGAGA